MKVDRLQFEIKWDDDTVTKQKWRVFWPQTDSDLRKVRHYKRYKRMMQRGKQKG